MKKSVTTNNQDIKIVSKCCGKITCGGPTGNPDECEYKDCRFYEKHKEYVKTKKEE